MFPTKTTTGVDVSATQNLLPVAEEATTSKAAQGSPATHFKFQQPAQTKRPPRSPPQQRNPKHPLKTTREEEDQRSTSGLPSLKSLLRINQDAQLLG
jgi:hypothetical protein